MIAYLQKKNGKILFTGTYMEVYIPEKLFKKSLNEFLGDRANIYGIFNFRIGDKNGNITESSTLHTFNLPAMFITRPSSTEIKTMQLKKEFDEEKYVIFKYYTGDELKEKFFPNRTIRAIECRADYLGVAWKTQETYERSRNKENIDLRYLDSFIKYVKILTKQQEEVF